MILYDISKDTLSSKVYPGDPKTEIRKIKQIKKGDEYNLSKISMSTHTGTHIDSPNHFYAKGKTIDNIRLSAFYGKCTVVTIKGVLTGKDMEKLLPYCKKRLILRGNGEAYLSSSASIVLAESDILLVGTDADSIAPEFDNTRTHYELAKANIVVLEGLDLRSVKDGVYTLCAFPIKLKGLEAAPCRAILMQQEKGY